MLRSSLKGSNGGSRTLLKAAFATSANAVRLICDAGETIQRHDHGACLKSSRRFRVKCGHSLMSMGTSTSCSSVKLSLTGQNEPCAGPADTTAWQQAGRERLTLTLTP